MVTDYLTELKKLEEKNFKLENMIKDVQDEEATFKKKLINELIDHVGDCKIDLYPTYSDGFITIPLEINQFEISFQTLKKIGSIFNCEDFTVTKIGDNIYIKIELPYKIDLE